MSEQKDNSGVLFKNDKWEEGSKAPPYTGTGMVNGEAVRIAAWVNTSKNGRKYFSIKFSEVSDAQEPKKKETIDELESDIPW